LTAEALAKPFDKLRVNGDAPLILLGNSVLGELVEPQIGLFARASAI
jgi:hypothetical protein